MKERLNDWMNECLKDEWMNDSTAHVHLLKWSYGKQQRHCRTYLFNTFVELVFKVWIVGGSLHPSPALEIHLTLRRHHVLITGVYIVHFDHFCVYDVVTITDIFFTDGREKNTSIRSCNKKNTAWVYLKFAQKNLLQGFGHDADVLIRLVVSARAQRGVGIQYRAVDDFVADVRWIHIKKLIEVCEWESSNSKAISISACFEFI